MIDLIVNKVVDMQLASALLFTLAISVVPNSNAYASESESIVDSPAQSAGQVQASRNQNHNVQPAYVFDKCNISTDSPALRASLNKHKNLEKVRKVKKQKKTES